MIRAAAAALLLPLVAAASDPLAGRVAGLAVQCIGVSSTGGPDIVDARTILYRRGADTLYRTEIEGCPALRPSSTLIVELYGGRMCRNDRFRVLGPSTTIPSGYCRFGSFVPYRKVKGRSG